MYLVCILNALHKPVNRTQCMCVSVCVQQRYGCICLHTPHTSYAITLHIRKVFDKNKTTGATHIWINTFLFITRTSLFMHHSRSYLNSLLHKFEYFVPLNSETDIQYILRTYTCIKCV